nr:hypothetical protein B0A51_12177 [Rachicladosporium sp. CCFEE 5018]
MHALTAPYLYRNVELNVKSLTDTVKDSLSNSNQSLQHIRRLVVRRLPLECTVLDQPQLAVLSSILTALPKDFLEAFALFNPGARMQCDLDYLLRLRQRGSRFYQMQRAETCPVLHLLPDMDELRNIRVLQLTLHSKDNCSKARSILQAAPCVTSLAVELSSVWLDLGYDDGPMVGEHVVTTLFGAEDTNSSKDALPKPHLRKLKLHRMDLTIAGTILPTLLECGKLHTLQLSECDNMVPLCESFAQLKLPLDVLDIKDASDGNKVGKSGVLLQSVRHLQRFRITRSVHDEANYDFEWAALQRHAATLHVLEIVDGEPDGLVFRANKAVDRSAAALKKLFRGCTSLKQLCMGGFELESCHWTDPTSGIDLLLLRSYPACLNGDMFVENDEDRVLFQAQVRHLATTLANKIFHELLPACPRLRVVVVDAWEMPQDEAPGHFATFAYLRASQTDVYGCTRAVAVEEPLHMIKHHEPCSDILEPEKFLAY